MRVRLRCKSRCAESHKRHRATGRVRLRLRAGTLTFHHVLSGQASQGLFFLTSAICAYYITLASPAASHARPH